jgi:ribonuclease G
MNKELIISSSRHETMAAILEDDQVAEIFIERDSQRGAVGNIYKGRVSKVLPGMQCAFVDIGLKREAFLYVSDVVGTTEQFERLEAGDADDDEAPARMNSQAKIEELLKPGQEILVQVSKDPLGTKGARITSHVALPGRFLVFMPTVDHIGVSRKVDARNERGRLRTIVKRFREEHGFTGGVILRTAAAGRPEEDIVADLSYFHQLWTDAREKTEEASAPAVIHREKSLVVKLLRDFLTEDFSAIRIDDEKEYQRAESFIKRIMPSLVSRTHRYTKEFPIFEEYGVQPEIEKALRSKVWLKSGGYIVVNHTEALVAIDVNTGRYVGKRTGRLEDTIVKTNLEAAKEIVRQFRLRDLGGIIVLDFIDMEERKNRQRVYQALEQELRKDRSPSKAIQVSEFGLIVVTRKRAKQSLERQLTDPCPYCSGSAVIKSTPTICYDILSEMRKLGGDLNGQSILLRVNPDIARAFKEEERSVLRELEQALGRKITVKPDAQLHHEQFDLMTF